MKKNKNHRWASVKARLKSVTVGCFDRRDPLMALIADWIRAKESQHLIKWMACEYGIFFLSDKMSAILLKTVVHSLAIPPVDAKTKGVNAPRYTSRTCWAYSLFFSLSCQRYSEARSFWQ